MNDFVGPHSEPGQCPTWYDTCNCETETLLWLIDKQKREIGELNADYSQLSDEFDDVKADRDALEKRLEFALKAARWLADNPPGTPVPDYVQEVTSVSAADFDPDQKEPYVDISIPRPKKLKRNKP